MTTDAVFSGSIPSLYDEYLGPLIFEPYAQDLANRLSALNVARVLETAAGTGIVTRALERALLPGGSIVATDLNQPMLDHAAERLLSSRVSWQQADAQALPFPDGAFDAVTGADEAFEVLRAVGVLASHLERVRTRPQDIGPNVRANVEEGLRYTAADVARAQLLQTAMYRRWQSFFRDWDVILTPSITISPRPWRELFPAEIDGRPTRTYFHWLALAYAVTLPGHPAVSLPVGLDRPVCHSACRSSARVAGMPSCCQWPPNSRRCWPVIPGPQDQCRISLA